MRNHGQTWREDVESVWRLLSYDGEVQWFAKHTTARAIGGRIKNLDALIGTVGNAVDLNWDLYLNLNPTTERPGAIKLRKSDVTHWRHILVDLDPLIPDAWAPGSIVDYAHVRVFTGRGYQLWLPRHDWKATPELDIAERYTRGYLKHLSDGLARYEPSWKVDSMCSDLPRVVRCPGSVNQRTGQRARIVGIELEGRRCFTTADLEPFAQTPEPPVQHIKIAGDVKFTDVLPHLNGKAKTFIQQGVPSGGRHSACYASAKQLHELGIDYMTAMPWVLNGAQLCYAHDGERVIARPLQTAEVMKILNRVYGGKHDSTPAPAVDPADIQHVIYGTSVTAHNPPDPSIVVGD